MPALKVIFLYLFERVRLTLLPVRIEMGINPVVTQEVSAPNSKKKIHLPDILNAFGVDYINTFEYLKKQKAIFVLR